MGTDIHLFVEANLGAEWRAIDPPTTAWQLKHGREPLDDLMCTWPIDRHYGLFEVLAGVRSRDLYAPLFGDRGFPSDVDQRIRDYDDEMVCHSHSWATLKEILAYREAISEVAPWFADFCAGLPVIVEAPIDDIRLVFCFDS